jgi:hypothetical protein
VSNHTGHVVINSSRPVASTPGIVANLKMLFRYTNPYFAALLLFATLCQSQTLALNLLPRQDAALPTCAVRLLLSGSRGVADNHQKGCIATALETSACNATDVACTCTNAQFLAEAGACIAQGCTVREALTAQNYSSVQCHAPVRDNSRAAWIPGIVGGLITIVAVSIRMAQKTPWFGGIFGWDDAVILLSMVRQTSPIRFSTLLITTNRRHFYQERCLASFVSAAAMHVHML